MSTGGAVLGSQWITADAEFLDLLERVRGLARHRLPSGDLKTLLQRGLEAYEHEIEKRRFAVGRRPGAAAKIRDERHALGVEKPSTNSSTPAHSPEHESAIEPASVVEHPLEHELTVGHTSVVDSRSASDHASVVDRSSACERASTLSHESAIEQGPPIGEGRTPDHERSRHRSRRVPAAVAREVYARDGKRCVFVSKAGRRCGSRGFLELDHATPWAVGGKHEAENLRVLCRAHNGRAARRYFGRGYMRAALERARRCDDQRT